MFLTCFVGVDRGFIGNVCPASHVCMWQFFLYVIHFRASRWKSGDLRTTNPSQECQVHCNSLVMRCRFFLHFKHKNTWDNVCTGTPVCQFECLSEMKCLNKYSDLPCQLLLVFCLRLKVILLLQKRPLFMSQVLYQLLSQILLTRFSLEDCRTTSVKIR